MRDARISFIVGCVMPAASRWAIKSLMGRVTSLLVAYREATADGCTYTYVTCRHAWSPHQISAFFFFLTPPRIWCHFGFYFVSVTVFFVRHHIETKKCQAKDGVCIVFKIWPCMSSFRFPKSWPSLGHHYCVPLL